MSEPKKVWYVTTGCYSGYSVVAHFSTEESADKYCGTLTDDNAEVHEAILDEQDLTGYVRVYSSQIELRTGELVTKFSDRRRMRSWVLASEAPKGRGHCVLESERSPRYAFSTSVVSQEHADKLAVEGRQAWLRSVAGQTVNRNVYGDWIPINGLLIKGGVYTEMPEQGATL